MLSTTAIAPPPFDDCSSADLVVRTPDAVDFHVHKTILSLVSPVFRDMFTLPPNPNASASETPVVNVQEDSSTWDQLLRLFYPTPQPPHINDLDGFASLLSAATKYMMEDVLKRISHALISHPSLETEALRMYAIAARYHLHDVMRAAAKSSLRRPILDYSVCRELGDITAICYRRLEMYHVACENAAASLATGVRHPWICGKEFVFIVKRKAPHCMCKDWIYQYSRDDSLVLCPQYFIAYLKRVAEKLKVCPSPAVATDLSMLEPAISAAGQCSVCGPRVYMDMSVFAGLLAKEVEAAVSKVDLMIDTDA